MFVWDVVAFQNLDQRRLGRIPQLPIGTLPPDETGFLNPCPASRTHSRPCYVRMGCRCFPESRSTPPGSHPSTSDRNSSTGRNRILEPVSCITNAFSALLCSYGMSLLSRISINAAWVASLNIG